MKNFVLNKKFENLLKQSKSFALNSDLKELYEKVVPPVATMEQIGKEMEAEVQHLTGIVQNFEMNLCIKATRQDLLAIDNKFRQYVKKDKQKAFLETTSEDLEKLRGDCS